MSSRRDKLNEAIDAFRHGMDCETDAQTAIKCLEKCIKIILALSLKSNAKNVFLSTSRQQLTVLYLHTTNKWRKAQLIQDQVNVQYLEEPSNYFYWKVQLVFLFSDFNAMNISLIGYKNLYSPPDQLWYYTAKMKYYFMMNKFTEGKHWCEIAAKIMEKELHYVNYADFQIWKLYGDLCEDKCISWHGHFDMGLMDHLPLIYGMVYLALKLNETEIDKPLEDFLWYWLCKQRYAFVEYHVAIQFFKCKMYLLSKQMMRRAIKRTPELPIIQKKGILDMKQIKSVYQSICCDYCGKMNNTKGIHLMTCVACMKAKYCSRKCQKKAWKYEHRFDCNFSCV
eukprot:129170_1